MGLRFISDLIGTLKDYFIINEVQVKNTNGKLTVRDADDTAYASTQLRDLELFGANDSAITFTVASGAVSSTYYVPDTSAAADGQAWIWSSSLGRFEWAAPTSPNGEYLQEESFNEGTSSPLLIFTPPAGALITQVQLEVLSAAAGGSPYASVGTEVDPDRDMDELDSRLKKVALYEVQPNTSVGPTPSGVVLTITPDGQTFSGEVRVWYSIPQ
jgi:hypothetical protein